MKKYVTIPNSIATKLSSADTARFTALAFTPDTKGYTDATFKQIGEYVSPAAPESENTIKEFVRRLKASNLINIDEVFMDGKKRNKYYMPKLESHFIIVNGSILEATISIEAKGFLIQLFTLTINGTYDCNLPVTKIVDKIKVSYPSALKYIKELLESDCIIKTKNGYTINSKYFNAGCSKEDKYISQIIKDIKGCEYLEDRYNKTDWSKIVNPEAYWTAVVCGFVGKKQYKAEITNEITL